MMVDDSDSSIERIVRLANKDACDAISNKIGRPLTSDESNAVSIFIGTEYFWARAEELLMFVQHRSVAEVTDAITGLATRLRDGTLASQVASHETTPRVVECDMCGTSGICYCIRKGPGNAVGLQTMRWHREMSSLQWNGSEMSV